MRRKIIILSILFLVFVGLGCGFLFSPKLRSSAAVLAQRAARNMRNTANRLSPAPQASGRFLMPRASQPPTASPKDKAKTTPPPEFQSKAGPLTDADFTEFSDVPNNYWYYWYAHAAAQNDITSAIGGSFRGYDLMRADAALGEIFNATGQPLCCVGWNSIGQSCHQGCYEMNIPYQSPNTYMSSDFWFYPHAVTSIIDGWSDTILHTFKPAGYDGVVFNDSCQFGEAVFNDTVSRALRIDRPDVPTGYPNGSFSPFDPDEWHDGCLGEQPSLNRYQAAAILTWNWNKPIYLGLGGAVMPQADDDVTREHLSEVDDSSIELLNEDGQTVSGATATLIYDGNNMLGFDFEESVHFPIQDFMNIYKNQWFSLKFNLPEGFELVSLLGFPYDGNTMGIGSSDYINKAFSPYIRYTGDQGKIEGQIFLPEGCSGSLITCSQLRYLYGEPGEPYEDLELAIANAIKDKNIYAWCTEGDTHYNVGEGKISSGPGIGFPLIYSINYHLPEGVTGDNCRLETDILPPLDFWFGNRDIALEESQSITQDLVLNSEKNSVIIKAVDADSGESISGATITYQQDNPNVTLDGEEAEVTDQNGIVGFRLRTFYEGDFPQNVTFRVTPPEDSDYIGQTIPVSLTGCAANTATVELEHDNGCQTVDGVEICWQGEEANQIKTDHPDLADQIAAAVTNFRSQSHRSDLPKRVNVVSGQGNGWTMTTPQNGLWGEIQLGTNALNEVLTSSPACVDSFIANEFGGLYLSYLQRDGDSSFAQHDFWVSSYDRPVQTGTTQFFNDTYCGTYAGCETSPNPPQDYYGLFSTNFCTMVDSNTRSQFESFIQTAIEPEKTWLKDLYNNQANLLGLPNISKIKNYLGLKP